MGLGKSAKYYRDNPEARRKKAKTDKRVNAQPAQIKKRVEANRKRREAKRNGQDVEGKDYDHKANRFVDSKTNRGRVGEGGRKRVKNKNKGKR